MRVKGAMLIAAVLTATAMSLKLPRRLTQALCSEGSLPAGATSFGAFDGAAQGPQAWASKSAYELTLNTKTTGYGHAGQYVNGECKLQATTCGAGYTHNEYAVTKTSATTATLPGAVSASDDACVKCAAGKWVRPEITAAAGRGGGVGGRCATAVGHGCVLRVLPRKHFLV